MQPLSPRESDRNEAIAALAGGLAHELNNLLSATLMMLELLSAEPVREGEDRSLLMAVEESSRRGVGLVRQLLWLSRGSQEGERFQLRHLLVDLLRVAQATFPPGIAVAGDFASDLWTVAGDPFQAYRRLLGLCEEAKERLAGGGKLTLAARNERLDALAAAQSPGLAAGPHVRVELQLGGGGGALRLDLPAWEGAADEAAEAAAGLAATGAGRLVLVAEGDAAVRQAMAAVLERASYRPLAAADGAEAVALFARQEEVVAAVVVGEGLDFLDPPAVARALRRLRGGVPVLAAGSADALRAWPAPVPLEGRLPKPFSGAQLLAALRQALADRSG